MKLLHHFLQRPVRHPHGRLSANQEASLGVGLSQRGMRADTRLDQASGNGVATEVGNGSAAEKRNGVAAALLHGPVATGAVHSDVATDQDAESRAGGEERDEEEEVLLQLLEHCWHSGQLNDDVAKKLTDRLAVGSTSWRDDAVNAAAVSNLADACAERSAPGSSSSSSSRIDERVVTSTEIEHGGKDDIVDDSKSLDSFALLEHTTCSQQEASAIESLNDDLLRSILSRLSVRSLACLSCASRRLRQLASDRCIWASSFCRLWGIASLDATSASLSFWRSKRPLFVVEHVVGGSDTMMSVAIKYGMQVNELRRINNMMSDHGIHTRPRLLIPISSPLSSFASQAPTNSLPSVRALCTASSLNSAVASSSSLSSPLPLTSSPLLPTPSHSHAHTSIPLLSSSSSITPQAYLHCTVECDPYASREVAVLRPRSSTSADTVALKTEHFSARAQQRRKDRIIQMLMRSLLIDLGTAEYYFAQSGGNVREALSMFSQDVQWERTRAR